MTVRADVAELLNAGYSDAAICRQLNLNWRIVSANRTELGLPKTRRGAVAAGSPEDLFWRRVQPTADGHLMWPSYTSETAPAIKHRSIRYSVHRLAFRIAHGRDPEGRVLTACGVTGCVHPRHVEDAAMRAQYNAIFGGAA